MENIDKKKTYSVAKSSTYVYILYIESETDNVPIESEPIDTIKVNKNNGSRSNLMIQILNPNKYG